MIISIYGDGIIGAAEEISLLKNKSESELSETDRIKLEAFEKIKKYNIDKEEFYLIKNKPESELNETDRKKLEAYEKIQRKRFDALLDLGIPNRQIYVDRYNENSILFSQNSKLMKYMQDNIARKRIIFHKRDIGKTSLTGDDPITGDEYEVSNKIIMHQLEQEELLQIC